MDSVVDGDDHAALFLLMLVEDLVRGPAPHVVPVVPSPVVVGDEPGVGLGLELADRGEVPAMEGRTPALLEDGAVEPLADGVVVGRPGGIRSWRSCFADQVGPERQCHVFGPVVREHGPDPDPVPSVVPAASGR